MTYNAGGWPIVDKPHGNCSICRTEATEEEDEE